MDLRSFWDVTEGYLDVHCLDSISYGTYMGTTDEYYEEGLGGWVSFKVYEVDGIKYIYVAARAGYSETRKLNKESCV